MSAALNGHDTVVKTLLERGATVDHAKAVGSNLIGCLCTGAGGLELIRHIWVCIGALQNGWTALMSAALNGHDAVVKTLSQWGAAVDHAATVGFVRRDSICHQQVTILYVGSLFACLLLVACMLVLVGSGSPVMCGFAFFFAGWLDGTDARSAERQRHCSQDAAGARRNGRHGDRGAQSGTIALMLQAFSWTALH